MAWQADYTALENAARIGNLEILNLLIENGIGLQTYPLRSIIKKEADGNFVEKSEEEKLEIIKILCNVPKFINLQDVSNFPLCFEFQSTS